MQPVHTFIRRMAIITTLGLPFILLQPACSTAGNICDAICECTKCNDRAEDECEIQVNAALDVADSYGCNDEADSAVECTLDNNDCDDTSFEVSAKCADDFEDLARCVDDNSATDIFGAVFISVQQPPTGDPQG